MEADTFSEIFPLAETAELETIEWLLSIATELNIPEGRVILAEEGWGNAVYFIVSGWVKLQEKHEEAITTLGIQGKGDFFGEMAILDESLRETEVVALSQVCLLEVPAQRFIQLLFKDPQLQHRLLQWTIRRLRKMHLLLQLRSESCMSRIAYLLIDLAETYGNDTGEGFTLLNLSPQDIADLVGTSLEEATKVLEKFQEKHWIQPDLKANILNLGNPRQLAQFFTRQ